ncbi:putative outer membrane starch-binding protein [Mucilaginibacter oryzae]|uniref:Putative outer membrane starch-binding protein n=1 Tax=Mucilaginibacter oryzae TaxID=468058 RepID=A0A316H891_9SPHI|nr:RagB/SusD family nutrient uptake outer membrane protein [Mucilaginibacter oryzae]PWK77204.1 putative outer membrane starch-binding protein [Mucilaginibacter oryzae]
MKKHTKYFTGLMMALTAIISGCKKDFFDTPPQDKLTLDNFYQTADQVQASTLILYNSPWFDWNNKSSWCITELLSGNAFSYSPDVINFSNFSVTGDNTQILAAWSSMYTVVAQANALINNLPAKVPSSVPASVVNNALGEAHYMRALAYFHLTRIWGNVPIVTNSIDMVSNYQVNTNPVTDIYKFIINDLKFAEANCTSTIRTGANTQGHVSSGSASALLAKVYLYMQDYTDARAEAEKVINSGEFKLYGVDIPGKTYNDLFKTANNNNEESIAAMQWQGGSPYGHGNSLQGFFAFTPQITGTGDGFGSVVGSIDLLNTYEAGDERRKATLMIPGDYYAEINQAQGGFTVPANAVTQGSTIFLKKYVVGTPADNGGKGGFLSAANNTYLMRYAEVLLIEAEAVLAGQASTANAAAIVPFNKVRQRAGLPPRTSITLNDIMHERRVELAFEGDYWFDLGRMDGFNSKSHPKAIAIISNQQRGQYVPKYTPTDANFLMPYPTTEVALNPKLLEPPVAFKF